MPDFAPAGLGALVERVGAQVESCLFAIELSFLPGREKLDGYSLHSLLSL